MAEPSGTLLLSSSLYSLTVRLAMPFSLLLFIPSLLVSYQTRLPNTINGGINPASTLLFAWFNANVIPETTPATGSLSLVSSVPALDGEGLNPEGVVKDTE